MVRKLTAFALAVGLLASAVPLAFAEGTEQTEEIETVEKDFSFDTGTVIRESIPQEFFGYNYEDGDGEMIGGKSVTSRGEHFFMTYDGTAYEPSVKTLKGVYPLNHIRFGGGSMNSNQWKMSLGEKYNHTLEVDRTFNDYANTVGWTNSPNFTGNKFYESTYLATNSKQMIGLGDKVRTMQAYGDDVSFTVTLNIMTDTLENLVDEVEFLTSDGSYNYNGGENWGKIRKDMYGIEKVNVFAWEMGNETDFSMKPEEYVETIKKIVPAIRAVDKTTPIAVHVATSDRGSVTVEFQRKILQECGDMIDYIVMHKYYTFNGVTAVCEPGLRNIISDIEKFGDPERHKIIITEYNTGWIATHDVWERNTAIESAVTNADFYIRMLNYPIVIETDFHAICGGGGVRNPKYKSDTGYSDGGPWWAYYVDADNKIKATAPVEVMKMIEDKREGAKMIGSDLQDFSLGKGAMASAVALEQENGDINILFTNMEEFKDLQINFQNEGYYLKEDIVMYGTNGRYSMNFYKTNEVNVDKTEHTDKVQCNSYTLPPMSVAMVTLSPIK